MPPGPIRALDPPADVCTPCQPTWFSCPALTVAITPADPHAVAVVDDATRFFRSADGGTTWPGPQ